MTIRNFNFSVRNLSPRTAQVTIYRTTAETSAPAALTTTQLDNLAYSFSTGVLSGLPAGWQQAQVEVDVTTTTALFYSYDIAVSESAYNGTQTFSNIGSPEGRISFGNDIQSDNFVASTSGWRIERDTGDAEFSNVDVRGASTVDSSTIGGDAAVGWSFISSDDRLGGALVSTGNVNGQGVAEVSTPTEWIAASVVDLAGFTASGQQGNFALQGRMTDGTDGAAVSDFTDSTLDFTLTFQYNDASGDILSSEVQTYTYSRDDFIFFSFGGTLLNFVNFSELNSITIPSGAETVSVLVNFSFSAGSNWGLLELDDTDPRYAALIPKSSRASAYVSSPNLSQFALEVSGGRGARINSIELFRGSATNVLTFGAEISGEETLYVQVSWDDVNDSGMDGSTNLQATIPFIKNTRASALAIYPGEDSDFSPRVISQPVYNRSNDYIGILSMSSLGTSLVISTTGAASNISNQRIRRIWSKLK